MTHKVPTTSNYIFKIISNYLFLLFLFSDNQSNPRAGFTKYELKSRNRIIDTKTTRTHMVKPIHS